MGQRLNVEVWNNGKVLANAYYHWSAYTDSAAEIVNNAIEYIKNNPQNDDNDLLYAIRILEATGAGLTDREIEYAKTLPSIAGQTFAECTGRNDGLIGISESEISSTRSWAEGAAFIFLDEKRVSFDVFFKATGWEWEKEQKEDYGNEDASWRNLEAVDVNLDDIKFDNWDLTKNYVLSKEEPFVCSLDKYKVVTPIR